MSEFTSLPIPSVPIGDQAAAVRTAIGVNLSQVGGASMTAQYDADGNLVTGTLRTEAHSSTANDLNGMAGNILLPDDKFIGWGASDQNGAGIYGFAHLGKLYAAIRYDRSHDSGGGELNIDCINRICFYWGDAWQMGNANGGNHYQFYHSGTASSGNTRRQSVPIGFNTSTWNGSAAVLNVMAMQAAPLDGSGTNSAIQFFSRATLGGAQAIAGTKIVEMTEDGTWSPGLAPGFASLTDGATVTVTCSKYRSVQAAKVTLAGNRTLAISGAEAGMRGVIYVTQDSTGSRLLTLPNGSATPSGWSLSTTPSAIDRLEWEFDGTYFYWSMVKGLTLPVDADAAAYLSATGATDSTGINNFVTGLKAMGLWATSACWLLRSTQNHGTGTTVRSLGGLGSFDGTMVGGPTWGANGIGFDGTDDRISLPNPAQSASLAAFTMFSVFDSDATTNRAVFGGFNSSTTQVAPQIFAGGSPLSGTNSANLFGNFSLDGTNTNASGGFISGGNTGSWQTAAMVADSSSVALYANTTSSAIAPARASYWNDIANWFIGSRGGVSYFFAGDIAFAFFSTTKLTSQQMTDLRDLYKTTIGAGLGLP